MPSPAPRFTRSSVTGPVPSPGPMRGPLRAWADRWNEGKYERFQVEFDGEFRSGGYRIPGVVEAGWRLGDPDEFRFFQAQFTEVTFR